MALFEGAKHYILQNLVLVREAVINIQGWVGCTESTVVAVAEVDHMEAGILFHQEGARSAFLT